MVRGIPNGKLVLHPFVPAYALTKSAETYNESQGVLSGLVTVIFPMPGVTSTQTVYLSTLALRQNFASFQLPFST